MLQGPISNLVIGGAALGLGIMVLEDYSGHGSLIRSVAGGLLILTGLYCAVNAVLSSGDG